MAFENNQQDAFNLRNDTESLKQWQSELDKATTSIGAAEVAAEEELAALKFKNLNALQDARVAKLEQLIALEDKGIRELAKARLTLSDRQFALRKKEIQKEFQLAKNAAEELLKIKSKKTQTSAKKPTSATKDITAASKTKSTGSAATKKGSGKTVPTGSVKKVDDAKSATPEVISLLSSIDGTLTSLRDATVAHIQSAEKVNNTEQSAPVDTPVEPITPNTDNITPPPTVIVEQPVVDPPKEREFSDSAKGLKEIDLGKYLFDDVLAMFEASQKAIQAQSPNIEEVLNSVMANGGKSTSQTSMDIAGDLLASFNSAEEAIKKVREFNEKQGLNRRITLLAAEQKLRAGHANTEHQTTQERIAAEAKADELEHNKKLYATEARRALSLAYLKEQNSLTEEQINAEAKLKFVKNNEERLLDQAAHKLRIEHINAEHNAMQALINAQAKADDIKNNREQYLEEALQNLKAGHAQKENELRLAGINAEAKATDIENNRKAYALEAELARENAIAEERNRLNEELIKAETEIAVNAAHRKELLDQEEQKERLGYLAEYQKLQVDSTSNIAKNITAEAFIALKKQTKAAEDSIARREKASEAAEKALATLRGKGTAAEKKALLEAQIKQRAAEKDWSDAKRMQQRDGESDEELQKRRENATKAEMAANSAMEALANLAQQLNAQTDKIGAKKAPIDTRLQGSRANDTILGSYWKQLARDMNKIGAVNPYFKQEDFANNIEALVNRGISFDIKQRAFLMTIQEKIANTFNVADGTLLRLIRIQQQDTTAGRLGMESALNSFLNSMYETSEYLTDVAASVRGSLEEMQALMEGAAGTELEFQVQKWMGSLYSVGMSQDAVQSIAQTFGQIASGDVSGLTGSGTGNLLIMAANEAGMSIADILQDGLDAKETNELMQAMVNYLAEIAETSSDSRVVQQQLANVYGMRASDLKAATNLASSIKDVSKQDLTYSGMLGQLNKMANSMFLRTSQGEALSNIWSNVQYTMATQMSNDPILYLLPKVATLLEDYAGGIDLPFLNVMGFGVDLNTSVAQLMNVAAMGGTILGALGPMISGLGSAVSGTLMLNNAGINTSGKAPVIARGAAQPLQHLGGLGISESGYIGNSSGEDVKKATLQDAEDDKKKQMIKAKDEESADDTATKANFAVVNIYNLLEEVAHGSQSLRVRVINNINGGGASGGSTAGGQNTVIGDNTNDGTTGAGAGKNGTDNGNWVLAF